MSVPTIRICNWDDFQHYRDRNPPWIKLHRALLDKREWHEADDAAARLLVECWLLASEGEQGGVIRKSAADIAWRVRRTEASIADALQTLARLGFVELENVDASTALTECAQPAPQRRGETETKTEGEARKIGGARARQLPDDWKPNDAHHELARSLGVTMKAELPQFRDHHLARGSTFKDWDRAFNTWLRNAPKFQKNAPSKGSQAATITSAPSDELAKRRADRERDRDGSADRAKVEAWKAAHPDEYRALEAEHMKGCGHDVIKRVAANARLMSEVLRRAEAA